MTDEWTSQLSEYLDGDLQVDQAQLLEAHLATCEACTTTLDELRAVQERAASLEDSEPSRDLWSGIATRIRAAHTGETPVVDIESRRPRRRFAFTATQLLAAAATLVVTAVGSTMLATRSESPSPGAATVIPVGIAASDASYDTAVDELVHALDEHRSQLDSATIVVLEQSLATIDQAIAEAVQALREEPNDQFLNSHLAHTKRQKLELLAQAVTLATAAS